MGAFSEVQGIAGNGYISMHAFVVNNQGIVEHEAASIAGGYPEYIITFREDIDITGKFKVEIIFLRAGLQREVVDLAGELGVKPGGCYSGVVQVSPGPG